MTFEIQLKFKIYNLKLNYFLYCKNNPPTPFIKGA